MKRFRHPFQKFLTAVFSLKRISAHLFFSLILCFGSLHHPLPAFCAFTLQDEQKVGKEFYDKLDKDGYLGHNQKAEAYLTRIGNTILANSRKAPFDFRFSIVKSSAVNAFATPGGYVYVNTGLIHLVETESELAGVLAHEISHANARHIAQMIDKSQKINMASLAALLAGALLGGGGQGTTAVAALSIAAATHLTLQYSREHEEEADRIGIAYLVQAGYDGRAMLDFLKIMRRYEFYSNTVPSYFLTHPGTDERIRYLDGMLQTTYRQRGKTSIVGGLKRIQATLALENKNLDSVREAYQQELKKNPDDVDVLYGLALIQDKLGLAPQALENIQRALTLSPDDADILRQTGILIFKAGRPAQAVGLLKKASDLNEGDESGLMYLAKSYEALGDLESTLKIYRKLETQQIIDLDIYYNMAMFYGRSNDPGTSHYHFGSYFKKKNKKESALYHFHAALPYFTKDSERGRDIEKEIKSLNK